MGKLYTLSLEVVESVSIDVELSVIKRIALSRPNDRHVVSNEPVLTVNSRLL
jgi:hypothetical protein